MVEFGKVKVELKIEPTEIPTAAVKAEVHSIQKLAKLLTSSALLGCLVA